MGRLYLQGFGLAHTASLPRVWQCSVRVSGE